MSQSEKGDNKIGTYRGKVRSFSRTDLSDNHQFYWKPPRIVATQVCDKKMKHKSNTSRRIGSQAISILLVVSIVLSLAPASAVADTSKTYSEQWSKSTTNYDSAVIGPNGDVYAVDVDNDIVEKLNKADGSVEWTYSPSNDLVESQTGRSFIDVNEDGVYVFTSSSGVHGIDKSTGNRWGSVSFSGNHGEIDARGNYMAKYMGESTSLHQFNTSGQSFTFNWDATGSNELRSLEVDSSGRVYTTQQSDERDLLKLDSSGNNAYSVADWFPDSPITVVINHSSSVNNREIYSGINTDDYYERSDDSGTSFSTSTNPVWSTNNNIGENIEHSDFAGNLGVVAVGGKDGGIYVLNRSDGSIYQSFSFSDASRVRSISARGNNFVAAQDDGSIRYYTTSSTTSNFQVSRESDNAPITEGSTYKVDVKVNNTASASDTQNITLDVNGTQEDSKSVSLGGNSETTVSLNWTSSGSDIGNQSVTIASDDDSVSYNITVNELSTTNPESPTAIGNFLDDISTAQSLLYILPFLALTWMAQRLLSVLSLLSWALAGIMLVMALLGFVSAPVYWGGYVMAIIGVIATALYTTNNV